MLFFIISCKNNEEQKESTSSESQTIVAASFNADSAYVYVAKQVSFGPRVPGSKSQKDCANWMEQKLKQFCDTVYRQETNVKAGNLKMLPCINLIGVINPAAKNRILLLAHWDSRPWADMDSKNQDKPIDAADDGGSGVGVLIEISRQLKMNKLPENLGVDILLTDVEDYGKSEWGDESYALGTQYWANTPHVQGYHAMFGILLDMVGAKGARFPLEGLSKGWAPQVQQQVWYIASQLGYSSMFTFEDGGLIVDDHEFVNKIAHIPTIDIINLQRTTQTTFAPHWHTHNDNMEIIDKNTLEIVGKTLLTFIQETGKTY